MAKGARSKLRAYFLSNLGEILSSNQLQKIAGISEWARRVRELGSEEGYKILTHNDRSDLKPGQYLLVDPKPQPAFAREISKESRSFILDRNGFTCQMCGAVAGEPHPYDKSQGGSDDPSNLRALCSVCNEGASNLTLERPSALKLLT